MATIKNDEFGPEMIVHVYDPKTKMEGIVVIDNTAIGPAKGGVRLCLTSRSKKCTGSRAP